jgi:hypothetical protein
MLTGVLVEGCDGIGVCACYQVWNPGAMKARGMPGGTIPPQNGLRSADFVAARRFKCLWLLPGHWTARDLRGHHCRQQGIAGHRRQASTERV